MPRRRLRPPGAFRAAGKQSVITMAGTLYARECAEPFFATLDPLPWTLGGRPVRFQFIGGVRDVPASKERQHLGLLGWRSVEATMDLLAAADRC